MEVIPPPSVVWLFWAGILHVCGGDPIRSFRQRKSNAYSPRMWRWSSTALLTLAHHEVFSTYVEVILTGVSLLDTIKSILHVCGGDPYQSTSMAAYHKYSPRMWRWSRYQYYQVQHLEVFSTYVEVILFLHPACSCDQRILHVCGGDPETEAYEELKNGYSPRMWRWSYGNDIIFWVRWVFSTHVESVTVLERTDK